MATRYLACQLLKWVCMRQLVGPLLLLALAACGCEMELEPGEDCAGRCDEAFDEQDAEGERAALIIFLNRDGGTYRATDTPMPESVPGQTTYLDAHVFGPDDPTTNTSGVLRLHSLLSGLDQTVLAPWQHSTDDWQAVKSCVRATFADFDVAVTEVEPPADDVYVEVAFAESSRQWGYSYQGPAGEAPSNQETCQPIEQAIVFVDAVGRWDQNIPLGICEDVAHEIGHVLGFDHDTGNDDSLMSFRPNKQGRAFLDTDLACENGECHRCGEPTQNTYQHLMTVLGPARHP